MPSRTFPLPAALAPRRVDPLRVSALNALPVRGGGVYVLYWMQQSQRAAHNDALEHAIDCADALGLPLVVGFGLTGRYPDANVRHYQFMLEGLQATQSALAARGILMVVRRGSPDQVALALARRAAAVIADRGYLRHQKRWRFAVAGDARCAVVQVEADVVVPVAVASPKAEFAARTIRPKITAQLDRFLKKLSSRSPRKSSLAVALKGLALDDIGGVLRREGGLDRSVPAVTAFFAGGTAAAQSALRRFIAGPLRRYQQRARPEAPAVSYLSPYLHFGQISPVVVALAARRARASAGDRASFLEELIVRRELAANFVEYTEDYDRFDVLPAWAQGTLHAHAADARPVTYTGAQLERAETHDRYWNAAMSEMKLTGYLHNALRMYWGKKILEWSDTPEAAYATALALNNKYFLDGRDASSYANIAWLFGQHDRPFAERAIYGKVRCMMASGLERKSDIGAYVERVGRMLARSMTTTHTARVRDRDRDRSHGRVRDRNP